MGISSQELRIGNWVQHEPHADELWEVDLNLLEAIECKNVYCVGISLSQEILLKCGFVKVSDKFKFKGAEVDLSLTFLWYEQVMVEFNGFYLTNIMHLHQLQNLYFALVGQELEVEL